MEVCPLRPAMLVFFHRVEPNISAIGAGLIFDDFNWGLVRVVRIHNRIGVCFTTAVVGLPKLGRIYSRLVGSQAV